jgi:hypothetical protein
METGGAGVMRGVGNIDSLSRVNLREEFRKLTAVQYRPTGVT